MTDSNHVISHVNRFGVTFYLHEGRTKTGKPRYFVAKTVRDGALSAMPEGYEFAESVNGVVSVRRVQTSVIPENDLRLVRVELARHEHLRFHRVEQVKGEIVIHEPTNQLLRTDLDGLLSLFPITRAIAEVVATDQAATTRYAPVMKFVPDKHGKAGIYLVYRMSYRGEGGWRCLSAGSLEELARRYVRPVGTDEFFELV